MLSHSLDLCTVRVASLATNDTADSEQSTSKHLHDRSQLFPSVMRATHEGIVILLRVLFGRLGKFLIDLAFFQEFCSLPSARRRHRFEETNHQPEDQSHLVPL